MKIKVIDRKGNQIEIEKSLWDNLSKLKNCQFRLADVPVPQEVIEFKPTPAKECHKETCEKECKHPDTEQPEQPEEIKQFIEKKKTNRGRKK